jgi:hypothetical protein
VTRGRIDKRQRQADLLRKKRARAASALTGAKTPPKAIPVAARRSRPSVARAEAPEPLPQHSYPVKRVALGKRQEPGGAGG